MKRPIQYESMESDKSLFVPDSQSENLAHQLPIAQHPSKFDGVTIEQMHQNPAFRQGFDPIDKATLCRDALAKSQDALAKSADNYTRTIRRALDGHTKKSPFNGL